MKLDEKGRFAPPPRLPSAAQRVSEAVAAWEGVHARTHWLLGDETEVDGADFYVGQEELGHIHLDSEAHVMVSSALADALIRAGLGERFRWSRAAVVFGIERPSDVEHALWLFRLNYDRRRGTPSDELFARIEARAAERKEEAARSGARRASA